MSNLSKCESALRQIVEGKAPLKVKLAALAEMTRPSVRWIQAMLARDIHPKVRLALSKRLAELQGQGQRNRESEYNQITKYLYDVAKEEAARPPASPIEVTKQRMGAGTAAAVVQKVKTEASLVPSDTPSALPASEPSIKQEQATPEPPAPAIVEAAKEKMPAPPIWFSAWENLTSGRDAGFNLEQAQQEVTLKEIERRQKAKREADPFWGKVPLGSW